jgi:RNA polymerase sigma-70 factor (ECF subfamily)
VTGSIALSLHSQASPTGITRGAEEQALIERCLSGDSEGFRPLVERYQRLIFSVALRMLAVRADAEDVSQQAFADAYRALDRFAGDSRDSAFSVWLLRIAVNRCKDVLKSKKRTEEPLHADVSGAEAAFAHVPSGPEALLMETEERRRLEAALRKVPSKYREVLVLKDIEDLSYEDIRSILRLPITTLKIRAVRARAMMRAHLAGDPR